MLQGEKEEIRKQQGNMWEKNDRRTCFPQRRPGGCEIFMGSLGAFHVIAGTAGLRFVSHNQCKGRVHCPVVRRQKQIQFIKNTPEEQQRLQIPVGNTPALPAATSLCLALPPLPSHTHLSHTLLTLPPPLQDLFSCGADTFLLGHWKAQEI